MFLEILEKNSSLPIDIINIILDYKYQLDRKNELDEIFKSNLILIKNYNHILDDFLPLNFVLYYLKYYTKKTNEISKYKFSFKVINCLGIKRPMDDIERYSYTYNDLKKIPYYSYYYYNLIKIVFLEDIGNVNNIYITLLDSDDLNSKLISKTKKRTGFFNTFKKLFKL